MINCNALTWLLKRSSLFILLLSMASPGTAETQAQVLRLLVWEGYAPTLQRQSFERLIQEKYGVELHLEVSYIAETEDCFRALRLKTADILSPAHNRINDKRFRMFDLGLLLPLNLDNIPNYAQVDSSFQYLPHLTYQGQPYGAPFAWGPYGLIYNADQITEPPTSWNALWEPRYRDKYTVADLDEHNIYITALALGYGEADLKSYDELDNERFRDKLASLVSNSHKLWQGVDTADDLDGLLMATSWGFSLPQLRERGGNWKWAPLQEKSPGWIDNFVISHTLKDKPQLRRIAEEWINYTLSPDFQATVLVEGLSARPVNSHSKELLSKELIETVGLGGAASSEELFILMPELDRRTRNGFNLLWRMAMKQRADRQEQGEQ
ncbi:MAG: extracellular solute-binding protein [Pseudomonadales bacterium]